MKYLKLITVIVILIVLQSYSKEVVAYFADSGETNNLDYIQEELASDKIVADSALSEQIAAPLDYLDNIPYFNLCSTCNIDTATLKTTNHKEYPKFPNHIYKERIRLIDQSSPFRLIYNAEVQKYIELYAYRKRMHTSKVLGLSDMYFPIFEECLDKYNLPLEFKYLAVVESALNPSIKSGAGAKGLWQFMLTTGKIYGLETSSYEDQRCDPYLATEAACKYFIDLYKTYGNWELVLAAYNCGPGNVNKAIRRSGYKKSYWELWPYLPKETRGYVPAFIAVNYVMTYAQEHDLHPLIPSKTYFHYDTLQVSHRVDLKKMSQQLDIPMDVITMLNPSYKIHVIPKTKEGRSLYLPIDKIGAFLDKEKQILAMSREPVHHHSPSQKKAQITHYVQNNETLFHIASIYGCTTSQIKKWNNLKSTKLKNTQKLVVGFVDEDVVAMAK